MTTEHYNNSNNRSQKQNVLVQYIHERDQEMGSDYFTRVPQRGRVGQVIRWGRYTFPPNVNINKTTDYFRRLNN